jgi:hypothetical protein
VTIDLYLESLLLSWKVYFTAKLLRTQCFAKLSEIHSQRVIIASFLAPAFQYHLYFFFANLSASTP